MDKPILLQGWSKNTIVASNFRNTYTIIGFCGFNLPTNAVDFYINDGTKLNPIELVWNILVATD